MTPDYWTRPIRTSRDSYDYGNTRLGETGLRTWGRALGTAVLCAGLVVAVAWAGLAGKKYSLFTNLDLLSAWVSAAQNVTGQGGTTHLQVSLGGGSQRFFRLNRRPQLFHQRQYNGGGFHRSMPS